jgi:GAF domain-containing protein
MRGVAMDISERRQAEEARVRRARQAVLQTDVSVAFASKGSLQEILQQTAESLVKNFDAALARIWTLNTDDDMLELRASAGLYTRLDGDYARIPLGKLKIGMIARQCRPHLTNDVRRDPLINNQEWARSEGIVAFAGYPLMSKIVWSG